MSQQITPQAHIDATVNNTSALSGSSDLPPLHPLYEYYKKKFSRSFNSHSDWAHFENKLRTYLDRHGKIADNALQAALYDIEREGWSSWDPFYQQKYQDLMASVAGRMINHTTFTLPSNSKPIWQDAPNALLNFQSTPSLPEVAEVVVVGAGLTGASTVYHLTVERKVHGIVLLERDQVCSGASGRNGGNFQLIDERFTGQFYEGLLKERFKALRAAFPSKTMDELTLLAQRQAVLLYQFGNVNSDLMNHIIEEEDIECHYSRSGWLKLAASEVEEKSFYDDAAFATKIGLAHMEILTPEEILKRYNIITEYCGRLIKKSGNYHPFMFVHAIISLCLKTGNLKFYTQSQVSAIEYGKIYARLTVRTPSGLQIIRAKKVVMATNGLCTDVIPELRFVMPWQSEILTLEHATDTLQQLTVTDNQGNFYYHFRPERSYTDSADGKKKGLVLFGGPDIIPSTKNGSEVKFNEGIMRSVLSKVSQSFPAMKGVPPSRYWTGTMGFTSDLVPIIDSLHGGRLVLAVAFNGFGGTFCILAGKLASILALDGRTAEVDQFAPADMFGIGRFKD